MMRSRRNGTAAEHERCRQQRSKGVIATASRQECVEEKLRLFV
jgi:hypothetical protein